MTNDPLADAIHQIMQNNKEKNLNKNFNTIMMIIDDMFDRNPQFFFGSLFDNLVDYKKIPYMDDSKEMEEF